MKNIIYYLFLLVAIALISGIILAGDASISMVKLVSLSGALVVYTVVISLVGEGRVEDERAEYHRYIANRIGLVVGTSVLSLGVLFQLLVKHQVDYWLLAILISINLSKIITLIWLGNKK